jgi:peroxiredoxin
VQLPDLQGKTVDLADLQGHSTLMLFWNPSCGFCQQMLPELRAWEDAPPSGAPKLLVVSTGTREANQAQGLRSPVVLEEGFATGRAFGASGTPSAVLVDERGAIASPVTVGAQAVLALARGEPPQAAVVPTAPPERKVGEPAPDFKLPDLNGKTVSVADLQGQRTLVLFWNMGCGFCQQMLPDLRAWDANPPKGAPKLLVIAQGSREESRGLALKAPILLDHSFRVGPTFGVNGTPMAVLIDADGRIASPPAAGAQPVFNLANGHGQL